MIPIQPTTFDQRAPGWRWRNLLEAPHRLGFFLGMVVLAASGLWWAAQQLARGGWLPAAGLELSPTLVHSAVMVLGFIPLYFGGFLFTAGPRWLGVEGPRAAQVAVPLAAQALGWLLWLAGASLHRDLALAGLALAGGGLVAMTRAFIHLVRRSPAPDRVHAICVAAALVFGCVSLLALPVAVAAEASALQRALVLGSLWGCVVPVFVVVAHRMIPFFTSSALPMVQAWRPFWVLWIMLSVAGFETIATWIAAFGGGDHPAGLVARAAVEMIAGTTVLVLAFAWGLVQSLKVRLLAMLHLGFSWLGLGLALGGVAHVVQAFQGEPVLPLAALHAITMGCLGSLLVAMVTRVSCGHSGRPLVAGNFIWSLFLLLQAATVLRIAATLPALPAQALLLGAALLWAGVMAAWAWRHIGWYGRPRADGRAG
jgi:uncharacterized protein involved in response to NO